MRIISANLNGIRSAASKGFFDWLRHAARRRRLRAGTQGAGRRPASRECIQRDGLTGYFHYAEKKGYSGVGIYTRTGADSRSSKASACPNSTPKAATSKPITAIWPSFRSTCLPVPARDERQQAKFRFMDVFFPHLEALIKPRPRNRHLRRLEHRAQGNRPQELEIQPEELRLPARGARLDDARVRRTRLGRRLPQPVPRATGEAYTWWSNRGQAWAKNVGWRIDYQIATPGIAATAHVRQRLQGRSASPTMRR